MNVQQLIHFYQDYKKQVWIAGVILGAIVLFAGQFLMRETVSTQPNQAKVAKVEENSDVQESIRVKKIFVEIKGAVLHPGMYEIIPESRVASLIELAGGLAEQADTRQINLAQLLQDEMVVYVPQIGEERSGQEIEVQPPQKTDTSKINLNKATLEELQKIPGVGQKKAEAILQYREEKGSFKKIDEITEIAGIGPQTFEKLKEFISVQ